MIKKHLRLYLFVGLMIACIIFLAFTMNNSTSADSESESEIYTISNASELKTFANKVNAGNSFEGKTVKLLADIDLNGSENNQWNPIGGSTNNTFKGIFEGDGHYIKHIYISNKSFSYNYGLFGINEGTIKNLYILDSLFDISSMQPSINIGAIAGENKGTITCCANYSDIITTVDADHAYTYIGGLVRIT